MKMEKPAVNLTYRIKDKPPFGQIVLAAIQQLLAIMVATIAVPAAVGNGLTASAALFGAGCGTMIYLLFTRSASPVFLGSSFAFIGPMLTAFGGAASMAIGYAGLIVGALIAGIVYVVIALVVKFCGVKWIDKLMPPVVIGPTVAIIGLSLSSYAISLLMSSDIEGGEPKIGLLCGLVTLVIAMLVSTFGKRTLKLIPFMVGIIGGYLLASMLYLVGKNTGNVSLQVIDYSAFSSVKSILSLPDFVFLRADWNGITASYLLTLFVAYAPVAFVVFAEHLADHKNLSSIIGVNLLEEPGLTRTLLGDGIGLRRVHRLRRPDRQRLHHQHLGCGHCLHPLLADHPAGCFPGNHPQLRHGRRLRCALRLYRQLRLQDVPGRGPEQQPQSLHGLRDVHRRCRRHDGHLRLGGNPYRRLCPDPRHPDESHALQG